MNRLHTSALKGSFQDSGVISLLRSSLDSPSAYNLWWRAIGGPSCAQALISEYVQPATESRILEIGCGPGTLAGYFQQYEYLGFDISSKYIDLARKRFPSAQFVCERVSRFSVSEQQSFDRVLGVGIVHHLEDREAAQLFELAYNALKPGGKLITLDGAWTQDQSSATGWLLSRDRGKFIRTEKEYIGIASRVFQDVKSTIRRDLLRIPYTHLILECVRGESRC
jgi:cyclopropane fatty-acyl-phospholipid synthase-like methyltransferase